MLRHLFMCAWTVMVMGCTTPDPLLWQRYTENDFPAQVQSVMTRLGDILDNEHKLTYGSWKIGFGQGTPPASYTCTPDTSCYIKISNLRCGRSPSGSIPCDLNLYDDATCQLSFPERREALRIACPLDVSLEPKTEDNKTKTPIASQKSRERPTRQRLLKSL